MKTTIANNKTLKTTDLGRKYKLQKIVQENHGKCEKFDEAVVIAQKEKQLLEDILK